MKEENRDGFARRREYPVGSVCVVVAASLSPRFLGEECTIVDGLAMRHPALMRDWLTMSCLRAGRSFTRHTTRCGSRGCRIQRMLGAGM